MKGCLKNKVPLKTCLLPLSCFILFTILSSQGVAATRSVTNCADDAGTVGSLRWALTGAAALDIIAFNILSGTAASTGEAYGGKVTSGSDVWYRIVITSPLTIDANSISVKGSTQTSSNSKGPEIEVRANGNFNVFYVSGDYVTIEGLAINHCVINGGSGISLNSANNGHIYGCYIGTTATGEASAPTKHMYGISLTGSGNNLIGGTTTGERNIISGSSNTGIYINDSSANKFFGNYIGFGSDGEKVIVNNVHGIALVGSSQNNLIGTSEGNGGNTIIAINSSFYSGIFIGTSVQNNYIFNNIIGLTSSESIPSSPGKYGIYLATGSNNNQIGGKGANEGNTISGHSDTGIYFTGAYSNKIFGNYIGFRSDGATPRANKSCGIYLGGSSYNNLIGTSEGGGGNVIVASNEASSSGIIFNGTNVNNNYIYNNIIGLTSSEAIPTQRGNIGIAVAGNASNNQIGGTGANQRNIISGNSTAGIYFNSTSNNKIFGNYIGFKSDGATPRANQSCGVYLDGSSQNNLIGTSESGGGNVIVASSESGSSGIFASGSNVSNNYIFNNIIGLTSSEAIPTPGGNIGILLTGESSNNQIGGTLPGQRNIIAGNSAYGIYFNNTSRNKIWGNYVGFKSDGATLRVNNSHGIVLTGSCESNLIGTSETGGGNLIVADFDMGSTSGVYFSGSQVRGNYIFNNIIGLTSSESLPSQQGDYGIGFADGANHNLIHGNLISGNSSNGISFSNAHSNEASGNFIGTDSTGIVGLGNAIGVRIESGAQYNKIGDGTEGGRNIISGNSYGISIINPNTNSNRILGNYIGTDASASAPLPNSANGILIAVGPKYNLVGGTREGEGNVISGNGQNGILITDSTSISNEVIGNNIGVGADGETSLGNSRYGIFIDTNSPRHRIGPSNKIAYNGDASYPAGIRLANASTGIVITQNSIFSNYGKGIYIDTGANPGASIPQVITANHNDATGLTQITGESAPAIGTVEVFKAQGNQGKTYLGSTIANGSGGWAINVSGLVSGDAVTATGTTANPETSEFSQTKEVITTVFKEYQPDNLIATLESGSDYAGENVFNLDGNNQTRTRTIANGTSATYYIKIENDANTTDEVIVKGRGSIGDWGLTYYDAKNGGSDITSSIIGSGWSTGILTSGASKEIRMVVANSGSAVSTLEALVTSESKTQTTLKDAVKAVATAVTTTTTTSTTTTTTTISTVTTTTTSTTTTTVPAKYYSETDLNVPGLTIDIPAGALTADATVTATVVTAPADPPAGFMIGGTIVNIQPTGLVFTAPVTITLSINGPLADPHVYYWNGTKWTKDGITIVSYTSTSITFTVSHFTIFTSMGALPTNLVRFGPNPYNPNSGSGRFWYWLSADKDTSIYLIDLSGTVAWKMTYPAGTNGGKANENNVEYDGKTAWGDALGNGVYIYKIVQDGKVIGGGKIAVIK